MKLRCLWINWTGPHIKIQALHPLPIMHRTYSKVTATVHRIQVGVHAIPRSRFMRTSERWGVNGHTTQYTNSISTVLWLVSSLQASFPVFRSLFATSSCTVCTCELYPLYCMVRLFLLVRFVVYIMCILYGPSEVPEIKLMMMMLCCCCFCLYLKFLVTYRTIVQAAQATKWSELFIDVKK